MTKFKEDKRLLLKELLKVIPSDIKIEFFKEHGVFNHTIRQLTGKEEVTEIKIKDADNINIYFKDSCYDKIRDKVISVKIGNTTESEKYLLEPLKKK